ncbi:MAG: lysophospholipase [Calditrichaeota bacterium]|nr:MAG: lysophospholipase [Calditrichota bacterium]MBL1206086.1 lysophospholipase [Calditrichota bacterium]NOG45912.1 lysophospholipase [Calditrichota bacterium]
MRSEHWMARCALFEKETPVIPKNGIIFLGDSITEEFEFSRHFGEASVINRGISGDTIDGVTDRLNISVFDLQPSRIFLMIGVNDIGSGFGSNEIKSNYTKLIELITKNLPQTKLVVQNILPCSLEWGQSTVDQIKEINKFIEKLCRNRGIQFLNLYNSFVDAKGYLRENYTRDGLHLNSKGYSIWAKILEESLLPGTNNG